MSTRTTKLSTWRKRIAKLEGCPLLEVCISEWDNGQLPALVWDDLDRILYQQGTARWTRLSSARAQLVGELHRRAAARESIRPLRDKLVEMVTSSHIDQCLPVLFALDDPPAPATWIHELLARVSPADRASALQVFLEELTSFYGREQARQDIVQLWRDSHFAEEEQETVIKTVLRRHVLDWATLPLLAPEAQDVARRLVVRGSLEVRDLGVGADGFSLTVAGAAPCPEHVRQAVSSLMIRVAFAANLGGARLAVDEMARLELAHFHPILFLSALRRDGRLMHRPIMHELFYFLEGDWPASLFATVGTSSLGLRVVQTLGIPLIRLLHMRLVLDSPSLSSSIAAPESALVPEVMLYLIGREGVDYVPEMRLAVGAGRGWRRRWAELTGEAVSTIFLEDALALDLTTLVRVLESTESTPDFMARTLSAERIVFEAKGATSWEYFRKSKRKAIRQLGKTGSARSWQQASGQNAKGRSFACNLFVASGGEVEATQFHVEDPPFAFERLFSEGWESDARRRHYAGVLQAAGLFEDAAAIGREPTSNVGSREGERFTLELGPELTKSFVGTFHQPVDLARSLGHPDPASLRAVRVFTGIESDLLDSIRRGSFPRARPFGPRRPHGLEASAIPPYGLLPDHKQDGTPRGVYSRMSDGAFLAVELT